MAITIMLSACKGKVTSADNKAGEVTDTTMFFQVTDYFRNQVNEVNKIPYFIYKLETVNGKTDSVTINTSEFVQWAKLFLKPDINDPSLKKLYHESVFHDATTNSYTLSYTTADKELPVQNIDVLLKDDAQTVKRIFIRRFYHSGDSSVIEQLSWKHNEQFQINRLVQSLNRKETSKQIIVVWNNKG